MTDIHLNLFSFFSIAILSLVYFFLITEKLNKVLVAIYGACLLILMQVFKTATHSSQTGAFEFVSKNLDVLGFVIGMMILVGIVRESGVFEGLAIWLVKLVGGKPFHLLAVVGLLTCVMTIFLSNIPTILILTPIVSILIKELKLPYLPFFMMLVTAANISGAITPISDPTTYYQAKTVGLGFMEVVQNSGLIAIVLLCVSYVYIALVFRTSLQAVKVSQKNVALFNPKAALKNHALLVYGMPLLAFAIVLMVTKDFIFKATGVTIDNATVALGCAFLAVFIFHKEPRRVFQELVDWETIFFFLGLFIVVGSLEFTEVISYFAKTLLVITEGSIPMLLAITSIGSGVLSTFIDNVPYNITMVGAIQEMAKSGIAVYPLWWALNLGTSIGGAGSPIGAACNVIAFSQLAKEKIHVGFFHYLKIAFPLVLINGGIVFVLLYLRYL